MFQGWRMVGVAFSMHMLASGLGFYALPRLLVPLAEEFSGGDRGPVALLLPAMSLPGLIVGPLIGRALTRYSLRAVILAGTLAMALGFLAATRAGALWQLLLIYATTMPLAVGALSSIGANALVANWFDRRRALALGISQVGVSIAGAIVTFFITWTLAQGGWRTTYAWFAAIALCAAPLFWLVIIERPSLVGAHPDGEPPADDAPPAAVLPEATFSAAMRDSRLWLIGMAAGLCFAGTTGLVQNIHAFATDAGHSNPGADSVLAVISVGAALGKLVFGALGVRLGELRTFWVAILSQAFAMAWLPAVRDSLPMLLALSGVFGLALGGVLPALVALLARLYGAAAFGPVMGYISPMLIPFQILGAPAAAFVKDELGSYDVAIYGFVVACGVAALLLLPLRRSVR